MSLFDKIKQEALKKVQDLAGGANNPGQQPQQSPYPTQSYGQQPPTPPGQAAQGGFFNPQMEQLISAALADGVLTEKEKQVLFKRAAAMGIDLDEFEMMLDARLFQMKQGQQAQSGAPTSDKYGDVKKCPGCGAMVQPFMTRCADCGYEFRNIGASSSFTLLSAKLEQLEKEGGTNQLFAAYGFGRTLGDKKANLIANFPVPTTKEDILEFLTMATPMAREASKFFAEQEDKKVNKAWKSKCEQIIIKARFAMKDDKATLAEIENYAKQLKIK